MVPMKSSIVKAVNNAVFQTNLLLFLEYSWLTVGLDQPICRIYDRSMNKIELGSFGEKVAEHRLKLKGYTIVERNWRSSAGEVDLIAYHEGCIIFVEVKTRTSDFFGTPEDSITYRKRKKMVEVAQSYLTEKDIANSTWRIDMVAVVCDRRGKVSRFDHYENVIT